MDDYKESYRRQTDDNYYTSSTNPIQEEKILNAQKEYLELKKEIDILKQERNYIERKLREKPYPIGYVPDYEKLRKKAKLKMQKNYQNNDENNNIKNKRISYNNDDFDENIYKKKVLDQLANAEIYADVGSTRDILNGFVDKCVNRSLYVYRNNNCHTCAQLLAMGKSTTNCPKCHKIFNYPVNSRTNWK
jgi:hypothetical protein